MAGARACARPCSTGRLTAATAIGGLTPLALEGNPLVSPLTYVLIGGLVSSTLLGRVVTPVLYWLLPPVR